MSQYRGRQERTSVCRVRPKKRLGQHFLTDRTYARRIAESVPAEPHAHVLEIGAGTGALTMPLVRRFPALHCVEMDSEAVAALRGTPAEHPVVVHQADALTFDFAEAGFPLHVVGNLPYGVGARIIRKTFSYGSAISSVTFMVQREVAERITARPHTKRSGFLTVFCGFFGAPRILFHLPPGAFFPKPKVASSVFQIMVRPEIDRILPPRDRAAFFALVDRGFRMRRKKLVNALADDGDKDRMGRGVREAGIDPNSRAEDLDVQQWLALYRSVAR